MMEEQNPKPEQPIDEPIVPISTESEPTQELEAEIILPPNDDFMEVHTHGHVHEDKKWKEYLFQFLMLFLAITAGFLMENQREHYIEHQRAKVLAAAVVEDLKADTLEITNSGKRTIGIAKIADSLMLQLEQPRHLQNDSLVQLYAASLLGYNFFDPQLGTYQQIKSSGALRYFKPEVSLQLTKYETSTNYIQKLSGECMNFRTHLLMPFFMKFENGQFLAAVRNKTHYSGTPYFKEPDADQFRMLYNLALTVKNTYNWYVERMKTHRENAEQLMAALNSEYVHD